VLDHGDGPGAEWARHARPGQLVAFTRPQGTLTARPSGSHLLIGEETAAVAFGAILRALPACQNTLTIIEADEPGDQLPLPGDVRWHYRHGRSAASSASLVHAVRDTGLPGPGTAYLAGEARTIQALRSHLTADRGWPGHAIITKPFWTPARKEWNNTACRSPATSAPPWNHSHSPREGKHCNHTTLSRVPPGPVHLPGQPGGRELFNYNETPSSR
jgi:NADPH-dependent ferric siderophore reductase